MGSSPGGSDGTKRVCLSAGDEAADLTADDGTGMEGLLEANASTRHCDSKVAQCAVPGIDVDVDVVRS
jgi:hypothetical protein